MHLLTRAQRPSVAGDSRPNVKGRRSLCVGSHTVAPWPHPGWLPLRLPTRRGFDTPPASVQNVGVDHGGRDVPVAEEFLDGAYVVAVLEEVGGKGVAEGVARGPS